MSTLNFILRQDMASIFFQGEAPITIRTEHPNFERIVRVLQDAQAKVEEKITELRSLVSLKSIIPTDEKLVVRGGKLFYRGKPVPEGVSRQFLLAFREGGDTRAIARFIMRMFDNPNASSVEQLYEFINHNEMMITEDGCFLGYKSVRGDFKDKYTGTLSNQPGQIVSMSRSDCDDRRNVTCSHGLHIAALDYARNFGGQGSPIVICKIDPKDVVSVPNDYNNQKMRVCRYEVIGVFDKGTDKPIFEKTVIDDQDLETDKLIGNTVKAGTEVTWSANGVVRTGTVFSLVMAGENAHKMVEQEDKEHGRLRFNPIEEFHRVLIRSSGAWYILPLARLEKKKASEAAPAPVVRHAEEILDVVKKGDRVEWSSIVGGVEHRFTGLARSVIPAGKSAMDTKKVPMSLVAAGKLFRYQVRFDQDIHPHADRVLVAVERDDGRTNYYAPLRAKVRIVR